MARAVFNEVSHSTLRRQFRFWQIHTPTSNCLISSETAHKSSRLPCIIIGAWRTGVAIDMVVAFATGPYAGKETGETAMLRTLFHKLRRLDVVLGDRCFGRWFMLALLQRLGVAFVVRLHQLRRADIRRARRLGHKDHLVAWQKAAVARHWRICMARSTWHLARSANKTNYCSWMWLANRMDADQFQFEDLQPCERD